MHVDVLSQLTEQIHSSEIGDILENSLNGHTPNQDDCLRLIRSDDVFLMGMTAGNLTRKKFGNKATEDLTDEVKKTAQVFKESGVAIEINTSGLRKTCQEMYPSFWNLKIYCEAGVPLTFGSDAHDPMDVGKDFETAVQLAQEAGYKEYVLFNDRKVERSIKMS